MQMKKSKSFWQRACDVLCCGQVQDGIEIGDHQDVSSGGNLDKLLKIQDAKEMTLLYGVEYMVCQCTDPDNLESPDDQSCPYRIVQKEPDMIQLRHIREGYKCEVKTPTSGWEPATVLKNMKRQKIIRVKCDYVKMFTLVEGKRTEQPYLDHRYGSCRSHEVFRCKKSANPDHQSDTEDIEQENEDDMKQQCHDESNGTPDTVVPAKESNESLTSTFGFTPTTEKVPPSARSEEPGSSRGAAVTKPVHNANEFHRASTEQDGDSQSTDSSGSGSTIPAENDIVIVLDAADPNVEIDSSIPRFRGMKNPGPASQQLRRLLELEDHEL